MLLPIIICIIVGYILGNFNGAIMFSTLLHHEDIRKKGSGNAGLTNFLRNYGSVDTVLVIVVDIGKTILACLIGRVLFSAFGFKDSEFLRLGSMICGAATVVGHIFPVLYQFKGGKGVLTICGLAAYMNFWVFLICICFFIIIVFITRYVSLGSVLSCILYPIMFWVFIPQNLPAILISVGISALAIFMHRSNINRLIKGKESKISFHSRKN